MPPMSDAKKPTGPLSAVSKLTGRSLDEVYRLFRLPDAPQPSAHVACVPVYDLEDAVAWVTPPSEPGGDIREPQPPFEPIRLDVPPAG